MATPSLHQPAYPDATPVAARFRPGDHVLASGAPALPVGKIDAVLDARSGVQLVVERAYHAGRFTPFAARDVVETIDDGETQLRWHIVGTTASELGHLALFRRVYGRLTPDPVRAMPPAAPDDDAIRDAIAEALADDPATAGAGINVRVRHGVAILDGWVRAVGSKMIAERIARITPGIWDARNRLVSDEELSAVARSRALADPTLVTEVEHIAADEGILTVRMKAGAGMEVAQAAESLRTLPGCRELRLVRGGAGEVGGADARGAHP